MRVHSFKKFNSKFLLVNFRSPKIPKLKTILEAIGYNVNIVEWDSITDDDIKGVSGILLSGSPTNITQTDMEPYFEKYSFLKTTNIPVLGICFGHQILGVLFGGKIYRGEDFHTDEIISILKKDPLLKGFKDGLVMKESHAEGVTLPPDFDCLGDSLNCSNEIMKHKTKNIYGVQFHPELSGTDGECILHNFINICINGTN